MILEDYYIYIFFNGACGFSRSLILILVSGKLRKKNRKKRREERTLAWFARSFVA